MDVFRFNLIHITIVLAVFVYYGKCQSLDEPIAKATGCYGDGETMPIYCSENLGRIYITDINVGAKNESFANETACGMGILPQDKPYECCSRESTDCFGKYNNTAAGYKTCDGENQCRNFLADHMLTGTFPCGSKYPDGHTTEYMEIQYYCINVERIVQLAGGSTEKNGKGNMLYVWSGDSSNYGSLSIGTKVCSIETDCGEIIRAVALDLQLESSSGFCKQLTLDDGGSTKMFDCSDFNSYTITTLHSSISNYMTLNVNNGAEPGGYLWLGFKASSNGNLTINCQTPKRTIECPLTTTETVTTEQTTTELLSTEQTTTEPLSTEQTTVEPTSTKQTTVKSTATEQTTVESTATEQTTVESTATQTTVTTATEQTTNKSLVAYAPKKKEKSYLGLILGILAAVVVIAGILIIGILYWKKRQKVKKKAQIHESVENGNSQTNTTARNPLTSINGGVAQTSGLPPIVHIEQETKKRKKKKHKYKRTGDETLTEENREEKKKKKKHKREDDGDDDTEKKKKKKHRKRLEETNISENGIQKNDADVNSIISLLLNDNKVHPASENSMFYLPPVSGTSEVISDQNGEKKKKKKKKKKHKKKKEDEEQNVSDC